MKYAVFFLFAFISITIRAETVLNVLVLYPDNLVSEYGQSSINSKVGLIESYTNTAFLNSGLDYRVNVIHHQVYNLSNSEYVSGSLRDEIAENSGVMALRDSWKPHVTVYLSRSKDGICGISNFPVFDINPRTGAYIYDRSSAILSVNVSGVNCQSSVYSHEIGHNAGVGHGRKQDAKGFPIETSRGWGVENSFVTIMAYPSEYGTAGRLQIFSNPNKSSCKSMACGTSIDNASAGINKYFTDYMYRYSSCYPTVKKYNKYNQFIGNECGNNVCMTWTSRRGQKICSDWE